VVASVGGYWQCVRCSFVNTLMLPHCEMCDAPRGSARALSPREAFVLMGAPSSASAGSMALSRSSSVEADAEASVHRGGDVPDWLCCPLTGHLFRDPVILPSGHSFDREALLVHWHARAGSKPRGRDPITDTEVESSDIVPHFALRDACDEWRVRVRSFEEDEELAMGRAMRAEDARASLDLSDWEVI
jgi:hypothetical protein